jgi:hypothetical protein
MGEHPMIRRPPGSPIPTTPRHEFLDRLHGLVEPDRYLEIGVQFGNSLWLTRDYTAAIGIDPHPMCEPPPNATIYSLTSDDFFKATSPATLSQPVDLAFIDGQHLIEYVVRDLANVEEWMRPGGIIAIDDVLPYSPDIATREQLPGDWAGDVWKLWPILAKWRQNLAITMVDVAPTGLMVLQRLDPVNGPAVLRNWHDAIAGTWAREVPAQTWMRNAGAPPDEAFAEIASLYDKLNG